MQSWLRCLLLAVCCLLVVGCGADRPETAEVSGRVTYMGKPVSKGQIVFYPEHGRIACGAIATDGTYRLTTYETGDGAVLGEHAITITAKLVTGGAPVAQSFEEEVRMASDKNAPRTLDVKVTWLAPEKYAERKTTTLKREVKPGENVIDFELSD